MRGWAKWVLYVFGLYNIVVGVLAVISPAITAGLYDVATVTADVMTAGRWLGALAIAIGYAALTMTRGGGKVLSNIVMTSAVATIVASIISLATGDAGWSTVSLDGIFQIAAVLAILASRDSAKARSDISTAG